MLATLKKKMVAYRCNLQRALEASEGRQDAFAKGVTSVTRAALSDFDRYFHIEMLVLEQPFLHGMIERYCFQDKKVCPICGKQMHLRHGKFGDFYGCSQFPDCQGARDQKGEISVNDALRFYLSGCLAEEESKAGQEDSRFCQLDI